jgi:glutathione S-transferase
VNPNSKIPALLDKAGPDGKPINIFESASIMLYLADKFNKFSFQGRPRERTEMMSW